MEYPNEYKPEKISKPEKQEQKKLEKATDRLEKQIKEKSYKKLCIFILICFDFLILIGILFLTTSPFAIVVVYAYVALITMIALVPLMIQEYLNVGRQPPRLIRWFNKFLEKILPINRKEMKIGPSILISFVFLVTIGGFVAISIITFADVIARDVFIYNYLIEIPAQQNEYGFFTFVANSASNSLVPAILWYLIIFIPVIFCFLFMTSGVYYRNTQPSKWLAIIVISPLVVLLPLFLTSSSIISPSIVVALIFIAAWFITLLIWYRQFTKRNALIVVSILFTQVLASFLMFYNFVFIEARDTVYWASDTINTSAYYNPLFLLIWFGVLIFIPLVVKGFDRLVKGKLRILGVLFAVGAAVIFQIFYFNLFSTAIYKAYEPYGNLMMGELFVGLGFFYFYLYLLLIPLFFIFGYFQIGIARWLYRTAQKYGNKRKHLNVFRIIGGILASIFIIGLIIVYYILPYSPADYQNMFVHGFSLYNGDFIRNITGSPFFIDNVLGITTYKELFVPSVLAITMLLLFYSSYRGAYNLALSADIIEEPDVKRFGLFNFILFTSPRSYKTRILFGLSLIFVFLGITAIFAFLKIHTYLFQAASDFTGWPPGLIVFGIFDGVKLGVSLIGMIIAIAIFLYIILRINLWDHADKVGLISCVLGIIFLFIPMPWILVLFGGIAALVIGIFALLMNSKIGIGGIILGVLCIIAVFYFVLLYT
ncbi:MAG: hypothetical protein HWN65_01270 [Candidatus Helarchaeota archaeon]|nr:hypothetical protein [Candidatus Helarchaeota archaeon]